MRLQPARSNCGQSDLDLVIKWLSTARGKDWFFFSRKECDLIRVLLCNRTTSFDLVLIWAGKKLPELRKHRLKNVGYFVTIVDGQVSLDNFTSLHHFSYVTWLFHGSFWPILIVQTKKIFPFHLTVVKISWNLMTPNFPHL